METDSMTSPSRQNGRYLAALRLVAFLAVLLVSCSALGHDPQQLIRDLEYSNIRMGKPLKLDPGFRRESVLETVAGSTLRGCYFANGYFALNERDELKTAYLQNLADQFAPHLDQLNPVSVSGVPLLEMSANKVVRRYGKPSVRKDGTVPFLTYYFRYPGDLLLDVTFYFKPDTRMRQVNSLKVMLSETNYAKHILGSNEEIVYDWPN